MFAVTFAVERENLRRNSIEKEAIVTDRYDRTFVGFQRFFERFSGRNIEVIRRLVKHQDVDSGINEFGERESSLLSTRQIADVLVDVIAREEKLSQKRTQFAGSRRRRRDPTQLHDDFVSIVEVFQLLRVIADFDFAAPTDLDRQRWNLYEDHFQGSCFAGSVRSHQADAHAAGDG